MSVKHIEFLKIRPSKLLVVEIRPLRCLIETKTGITKTSKWMTFEHWKELRRLVNVIADEYEREKQMLMVTKDITLNEHKMMDGNLLKIGYMYVRNSSSSCHYLVPRDNATWTDDEEDNDGDLKDKGGKYKPLTPCAEMLVVSVRLQKHKGPNRGFKTPMSPVAADKQLVKALDSSFVVTNTISDYFAGQKSSAQESQSSIITTGSSSASQDEIVLDDMNEVSDIGQIKKGMDQTVQDLYMVEEKQRTKKNRSNCYVGSIPEKEDMKFVNNKETSVNKLSLRKETYETEMTDLQKIRIETSLNKQMNTEWIKSEDFSCTDEYEEWEDEQCYNVGLSHGTLSEYKEEEGKNLHEDMKEGIPLSYSPVHEEEYEFASVSNKDVEGDYSNECLGNRFVKEEEDTIVDSATRFVKEEEDTIVDPATRFVKEEDTIVDSATRFVKEEDTIVESATSVRDSHRDVCLTNDQEEDSHDCYSPASPVFRCSKKAGKRKIITPPSSIKCKNNPVNIEDYETLPDIENKDTVDDLPVLGNNNCLDHQLTVKIPFDFLHNTSLSPIAKCRDLEEIKVRDKSRHKMNMLFGALETDDSFDQSVEDTPDIGKLKSEIPLEEEYIPKALVQNAPEIPEIHSVYDPSPIQNMQSNSQLSTKIECSPPILQSYSAVVSSSESEVTPTKRTLHRRSKRIQSEGFYTEWNYSDVPRERKVEKGRRNKKVKYIRQRDNSNSNSSCDESQEDSKANKAPLLRLWHKNIYKKDMEGEHSKMSKVTSNESMLSCAENDKSSLCADSKKTKRKVSKSKEHGKKHSSGKKDEKSRICPDLEHDEQHSSGKKDEPNRICPDLEHDKQHSSGKKDEPNRICPDLEHDKQHSSGKKCETNRISPNCDLDFRLIPEGNPTLDYMEEELSELFSFSQIISSENSKKTRKQQDTVHSSGRKKERNRICPDLEHDKHHSSGKKDETNGICTNLDEHDKQHSSGKKDKKNRLCPDLEHDNQHSDLDFRLIPEGNLTLDYMEEETELFSFSQIISSENSKKTRKQQDTMHSSGQKQETNRICLDRNDWHSSGRKNERNGVCPDHDEQHRSGRKNERNEVFPDCDKHDEQHSSSRKNERNRICPDRNAKKHLDFKVMSEGYLTLDGVEEEPDLFSFSQLISSENSKKRGRHDSEDMHHMVNQDSKKKGQNNGESNQIGSQDSKKKKGENHGENNQINSQDSKKKRQNSEESNQISTQDSKKKGRQNSEESNQISTQDSKKKGRQNSEESNQISTQDSKKKGRQNSGESNEIGSKDQESDAWLLPGPSGIEDLKKKGRQNSGESNEIGSKDQESHAWLLPGPSGIKDLSTGIRKRGRPRKTDIEKSGTDIEKSGTDIRKSRRPRKTDIEKSGTDIRKRGRLCKTDIEKRGTGNNTKTNGKINVNTRKKSISPVKSNREHLTKTYRKKNKSWETESEKQKSVHSKLLEGERNTQKGCGNSKSRGRQIKKNVKNIPKCNTSINERELGILRYINGKSDKIKCTNKKNGNCETGTNAMSQDLDLTAFTNVTSDIDENDKGNQKEVFKTVKNHKKAVKSERKYPRSGAKKDKLDVLEEMEENVICESEETREGREYFRLMQMEIESFDKKGYYSEEDTFETQKSKTRKDKCISDFKTRRKRKPKTPEKQPKLKLFMMKQEAKREVENFMAQIEKEKVQDRGKKCKNTIFSVKGKCIENKTVSRLSNVDMFEDCDTPSLTSQQEESPLVEASFSVEGQSNKSDLCVEGDQLSETSGPSYSLDLGINDSEDPLLAPLSRHDSEDTLLAPLSRNDNEDTLLAPLSRLDESEGDSVVITKEESGLDILKDHYCKIRGLSKVDLDQWLKQTDKYLISIMNGELTNERHKMFKKLGWQFSDMFNTDVYGAFDEDQSEYVIDELQRIYSQTLGTYVKDKTTHFRYVFKVLAPCVLIKVTKDVLSLPTENAAEKILSDICVKLDIC